MFDHLPFDIQSQIIKRLPVEALLQFRSVSKHYKSFIDSPKFINNYHVNNANPQHHLFLRYNNLDNVQTHTSIIDKNTFSQHKFPLTRPMPLRLLTHTLILGSVNGLLCFWGFYRNANSENKMVVIWNPTVRKSVAIVIPEVVFKHTIIGFGVCLDTSDPKLVKISVDTKSRMWEVEVFTLSTRVWKTVFTGAPFKSCSLLLDQVFVNGVIYFRAYRRVSNIVISFDLESEKFGEMCLPERLVHISSPLDLHVVKVNESLGLLEYYDEGDMEVCGVWKREDGANKTFSKLYTVKVEGKSLYHRVLGFRYNGEVVIELDDDNYGESKIAVYEPLSGHINDVGINGKLHTISVRSYMETLLLLNESDSIIR